MLSLEDAETGTFVWFDGASESARKKYNGKVQKRRTEVTGMFRRAKVDVVDLFCGEDPVGPLMNFFRMRKRKKR